MDHQIRSAKLKSKISRKHFTQANASKKRKEDEKVVVRVKIKGDPKKYKTQGPPDDSWSWRKYGQKPIKGSPYPRGYYRCSTSKGCSAKKQVERCSSDTKMLIITYTSAHNHPGPDPLASNIIIGQEPTEHYLFPESEENPATPKQDEEQEEEQEEEAVEKVVDSCDEDHFHYCTSPFNGSQDIIINKCENLLLEDLGTNYESPSVVVNQKPLSCPRRMTFSSSKSEENDFYDELEELPTSSFLASFMRKNFFEERVLVQSS